MTNVHLAKRRRVLFSAEPQDSIVSQLYILLTAAKRAVSYC